MRDADDGDPGFLTELGRFDRSFFVRMIGSFLGLLVVVAIVELGIRFGAQLYRYHQEGPAEVETAAEQLAADIRSIMINEGGPVASRAVYPILDRTYERAGLQIAVEPSPATVESIQEVFGFRPRGIPAVFPEGTHQQARVHLRAESFCLQCHVTASEGDVLGTVVVRDYLSASLSGWWDQVRLSATVSAAKIIIHVTIVFFLLRTLMEPLLSLRGAVARLADGSGGLRTRAEVRSSDEFGELAHDLNAFLDRITGLLQ
ncbi:MAG: HAMP domain-containing protein, partial [Longimicrobiales bacterium]|nr:HAMP domain-containing protein [Longimicrobiales bacterium]